MRNSMKNQNLRKRRNEYDMVAEILKITEHPTKKWHIVGRTFSNFNMINYYLARMLEKDLIIETAGNPHKKSKMYQRTKRGEEYLELYNNLKEYVE